MNSKSKTEPQDLNTQFLFHVYEEADGYEDRPVATAPFGLIHGLTFKQIADVVDALMGEGFLVVHTPTHVSLTNKGLVEVERLLDELEQVVQDKPDEVAGYPEPAPAPSLPPQTGKPRVVFISHQNAHQELAKVIKQQLEEAFESQVRVLLSSEISSAPGSEQWKKRIVKVTKSLSVHLLLCDESTLEIPWINMEIGASWLLGKPVIPICFGKLNKGMLPVPYNDSLALDLDDDFADKLLTGLEKYLAPNYPAKRQPAVFMEVVKAAMKKT